MKKTQVVLFSYIPLFYPDPYISVEDQLGDLSLSQQFDAVIWLTNGKEFELIVVSENAKAMVDHMNYWSENKPDKWFTVDVELNKNGDYLIVLAPKLDRSIERYKLQYQLTNKLPIPKHYDFKVVFALMHFSSNRKDLIFKQNKIKVGFIDRNDFDPNCTDVDAFKGRTIALGSLDLNLNSRIAREAYRNMMHEGKLN